jgi:hypothetical protein
VLQRVKGTNKEYGFTQRMLSLPVKPWWGKSSQELKRLYDAYEKCLVILAGEFRTSTPGRSRMTGSPDSQLGSPPNARTRVPSRRKDFLGCTHPQYEGWRC